MQLQITRLFLYPLKGGSGVAMNYIGVHSQSQGLRGDRAWMAVRPDGTLLSQDAHPKLSLDEAMRSGNGYGVWLSTSRDGRFSNIHASPHNMGGGAELTVGIHQGQSLGIDCGDKAAQWLSELIGTNCRVVASVARRRTLALGSNAGSEISIRDRHPVLICSEESLQALNDQTGYTLDMRRFRPNIVVSGAPAWDEDHWKKLVINEGQLDEIRLTGVKRRARCAVPNVDPDTGVPTKGLNVSRELAKMGRQMPVFPEDPKSEQGIIFGIELVLAPTKAFLLDINDTITVKSRYD